MIYKKIRAIALNIEKKYPFTKKTIESIRRGTYSFRSLCLIVNAIPRTLGFIDKRYSNLLKYKNLHKGKRCFIIATGPSLKIEDLERLKNEYTFSMNSIILSYNETDFRPTYYGIQDRKVYQNLYVELKKHSNEQKVFYSEGLKYLRNGENKEYQYRPLRTWIPIKLNWQYHMYDFNYTQKWFSKFHRNVYAYAYDGYTITFTIMQLAVYMGFTEIYLLGCDHNYPKDITKQHFKDHGVHEPDKYRVTSGERMDTAYIAAKKYADKHGIKIFNATRGGKLEIFPRVDLDDILEK